jgi:hypothetical protein
MIHNGEKEDEENHTSYIMGLLRMSTRCRSNVD